MREATVSATIFVLASTVIDAVAGLHCRCLSSKISIFVFMLDNKKLIGLNSINIVSDIQVSAAAVRGYIIHVPEVRLHIDVIATHE